jgi:hypothetical protein
MTKQTPIEAARQTGNGWRGIELALVADLDLADACREWIKGCTCSPRNRPQDCQECTDGFLKAVLDRAQRHGLTIGENSLFDQFGSFGEMPND